MTRKQLSTKRVDTIFKIQKVINSLEEKNSGSDSERAVIVRLCNKQKNINTAMLILDEIVFSKKDVATVYRKNRTNRVAIKLAMAVLMKSGE